LTISSQDLMPMLTVFALFIPWLVLSVSQVCSDNFILFILSTHARCSGKKIIFIFAQLREKLTNFSKKFRSTHGGCNNTYWHSHWVAAIEKFNFKTNWLSF